MELADSRTVGGAGEAQNFDVVLGLLKPLRCVIVAGFRLDDGDREVRTVTKEAIRPPASACPGRLAAETLRTLMKSRVRYLACEDKRDIIAPLGEPRPDGRANREPIAESLREAPR